MKCLALKGTALWWHDETAGRGIVEERSHGTLRRVPPLRQGLGIACRPLLQCRGVPLARRRTPEEKPLGTQAGGRRQATGTFTRSMCLSGCIAVRFSKDLRQGARLSSPCCSCRRQAPSSQFQIPRSQFRGILFTLLCMFPSLWILKLQTYRA